MKTIGTFSAPVAEQLLRLAQGESAFTGYNGEYNPNEEGLHVVRLTEDLAAPADVDNPTRAEAKFQSPGTDDSYGDLAGVVEVTNRFTGFSASTDDLIIVAEIEGELVPLSAGAGGSGSGSSGCCCCVTTNVATAELSTGEWTVDRRIPCEQVGDAYDDSEDNLKVTISFPAPSLMVFIKEADSDDYIWEFDETDVTVAATYDDGTTATVTSLDGTGTFIPHNAGKTTTEFDWSFVFPTQPEPV